MNKAYKVLVRTRVGIEENFVSASEKMQLDLIKKEERKERFKEDKEKSEDMYKLAKERRIQLRRLDMGKEIL
ncbi:hypothetical protein V1503_18815 [Bacillus sp. SCS-151]|uniref:hypothetical protein n=1 Tax=Nanhaiella sioensis TaxID=3115293 RepID=UPI00397C2BA2